MKKLNKRGRNAQLQRQALANAAALGNPFAYSNIPGFNIPGQNNHLMGLGMFNNPGNLNLPTLPPMPGSGANSSSGISTAGYFGSTMASEIPQNVPTSLPTLENNIGAFSSNPI